MSFSFVFFFFFFFTAYLLLFFPYPTLVKGKVKEGEEVLFLGMRKTEDPNVHFEPILPLFQEHITWKVQLGDLYELKYSYLILS